MAKQIHTEVQNCQGCPYHKRRNFRVHVCDNPDAQTDEITLEYNNDRELPLAEGEYTWVIPSWCPLDDVK